MGSNYSITVLDFDGSEKYMETYDDKDCWVLNLVEFYACGYARVRETCNRAVVKEVWGV